MYFIKRAWINVKRNPSKGATLLALSLLLSSLVAGAIIANQAINNTALQTRQSVLPVVTVSADLEALAESDGELPILELITEEITQEIGNLPHVRYFDYSLRMSPRTRFDVYIPKIEDENTDVSMIDGNLYGEFNFFWMNGVSQPDVIHIEEGLFELVEGRVFTEADMQPPANPTDPTPILISREIAQLNNLSVGTVFSLYFEHFVLPEGAVIPDGGLVIDPNELWDHPYSNWVFVPYEFEVIGILDVDYHLASNQENFHMQLVVFNTVFAPNWKVEKMIREQFEPHLQWRTIFNIEGARPLEEQLTPVVFWVLEDPLHLESFIAEATPLLPDFYKIDAWTQVFSPLNNAMESMQWMANLILWFGVSATIVVLSLLITLYLRDRRHELGVYLALGEKRVKIVFQILLEVVPMTLLGMTIAVFIGNIIATYVSQGMLRQMLIQDGIWTTGSTFIGEWQEYSQLEFMGMGREVTIDELTELFEISFNRRVIVIFYTIGVITVMLATIMPITYILKLNVKDILEQAKIG